MTHLRLNISRTRYLHLPSLECDGVDRTEGSVAGGGILRPGGTLSPRRSLYGLVDDITLSYEGGRLVRADDSGEDCTLSVATDWSESVQENGEYTYDPDGRMTSDKNKGVTQITYNALGLVETVHTPLGQIRHTYDSDGRLAVKSYGTLEWVTVDMGFTSFTRQEYRESRRVDYLGELVLEDGKVYRRLHEAGWTDGEGREVAAVRDWRGSLRATWTDTGEGGEKVFDNLTGYYPYGLPWADWQGSERWLYGGKELEREHGLWTYDFHAREQDPALGRFRAPDPLADRYKHLNPYLYAAANPITYTDPTGCILQVNEPNTGNITRLSQEMMNRSDDDFNASMSEMGFNSKSYTYQVLSAYRYLNKSPTGAAAIQTLIESEYVVNVVKGNRRNCFTPDSESASCARNEEVLSILGPISKHTGCGGTLQWDPKFITYGMCKDAREPSVPEISLGHETGHALGAVLGLCYPSQDRKGLSNKMYDAAYEEIPKEEWRAVFFENTLRGDLNLPLRYNYKVLPLGVPDGYNSGFKMVSPTGKPIQYVPEINK